MRITSMLPDIQNQMQSSQDLLSTALQQVSTGLRVNRLSDDPSASGAMVRSLAASAVADSYTATGSSTLSALQAADSALSSVVSSLNSAVSMGTQGANGTLQSSDRAGIAQQVQSLISGVVAQANTQFMGRYLFAGSASTTPPFVPASSSYASSATSLSVSTPLTAGSATTLRDAGTGEAFVFKASAGDTVDTLQQAVSAAVSAGTLSAGISVSLSASGQLNITSAAGLVADSNDPALGPLTATSGTAVAGAFAYVGNDTVNRVAIGDTLSVSGNISGANVFTSGGQVLQSLGNLAKALQSGTQTQIASATNAVSTALRSVSQNRIPLGNDISQINSQESYLAQEKITLTTQQTSLVGINLAEAATNLAQAQLGNSAVLAAAAKVVPQTLLDYLK